ncbi:MAG: TaqI-like C-terminal specificity domain-containing protein [Mycobacterium leprae]
MRGLQADSEATLTAERAGVAAWLKQLRASESDPVGSLYQAMMARSLVRTPAGLQVEYSTGLHRRTGVYYTDDDLVRYMVGQARRYLPTARSVVDPACGMGAFLGAAREGVTRLVGLDADPVAIEACRSRVPEADLHVLDALLAPFPGGFDLCLGNPPYISSGLRGVPQVDQARSAALRKRYLHTAQYKLNTYPMFVERGLDLIREGGVLGYILPDSFLSGRFFAGLRRLILQHTLLELTLIRTDFWRHGNVGQSVVLFVRKGAAPPGHSVWIRSCQDLGELLSDAGGERLPLGDVIWGSLQRFRVIPDGSTRHDVLAMERSCAPETIGHFVRPYSGLIAKHGQASLLRSANPHLRGPWGRLLRSGGEIDRYQLRWAGEEVCLDPKLIKSGGHLPHYRGEKLLLRQTADSLRAVYDDCGYYCLNNIHLLVPRGSGLPMRALLGIINSGVFNRYYRALTMESGRLYPQVDLDLLQDLPLPQLGLDTIQCLVQLVMERETAAPERATVVEQRIERMVGKLYGLPR